MAFFTSAIGTLQTLVIALGAGLGVWGVVNLLEGYGSDNPGAKSQGMKQLMAGGGIIVLGTTLIPLLSSLFSVVILLNFETFYVHCFHKKNFSQIFYFRVIFSLKKLVLPRLSGASIRQQSPG